MIVSSAPLLLTNLFLLIDFDENKFVPFSRLLHIYRNETTFSTAVIIYVQFNKLDAIVSLSTLSLPLFLSLARSLSNFHDIKLCHKIIIKFNSLCPAVSHRMWWKQVKMISSSLVFILVYKTISRFSWTAINKWLQTVYPYTILPKYPLSLQHAHRFPQTG